MLLFGRSPRPPRVPLLLPLPGMQHPLDICTRRCRRSHSTARPLTTVSRASPPPRPGGGTSLTTSSVPSTNRRAARIFSPRRKKRRKGRKRQRGARERTRRTGREPEDAHRKETPTAGGRPRGAAGERERFGITPEARCGPIAIRKEAFFMGAARSAGLCDKN